MSGLVPYANRAGRNIASWGNRIHRHYRTAQVVQGAARQLTNAYNQYQNTRRPVRNNRPTRSAPQGAGRAAVLQRASGNSRVGAKNKRSFKKKRKRAVKVNPMLRKKIQHVIAGEESHLVGTHIMVPRITIERSLLANKTHYTMCPMGKTSAGANPGAIVAGGMHNWNTVLDSASKLYNNKPSTEFPAVGDADNFDSKTTTINVEYAKLSMWLKNNSNRTYHISFLKFTSKMDADTNNPLLAWNTALLNEQDNSRLVEGFSMAGIDTTRILQTEWPHSPNYYYQFRKLWHVEEIKSVIEPGQVVAQSIDLPTGEMTGAKYFNEGVYQHFHKGAVFCGISYLPDVVQQKANTVAPGVGKAGYFLDVDATADTAPPLGGLLIESKIVRKIKMPEPTGWIGTGVAAGAGEAIPLESRIARVFYEDFEEASVLNPVNERIDPVEPLG